MTLTVTLTHSQISIRTLIFTQVDDEVDEVITLDEVSLIPEPGCPCARVGAALVA